MKRVFVLAAWALAAAVVILTLGPASDRPQLGHPQGERFAAFFVLGACWAAAYARRERRVLAGLVLGAIALELAQALAPGRDPGLPDVLAKIAGAAAGVGATALVGRALKAARAGPTGPQPSARWDRSPS